VSRCLLPVAALLVLAMPSPAPAGPPAAGPVETRTRAGQEPETREPRLDGSRALASVYQAILGARFDELDAGLRRACPPAPPEACQLLRVTAAWWQIQLDPHDRSRDAAFRLAVDEAIVAAEAWAARAPDEAQAWFYVGGAYALRVQFRVLRQERLAAARDGKRIKVALERAVTLDPQLQDAYFGLGLYRYYAAVAPTAARVLRWLLFLPGGNRQEGLEQMLRAQQTGELLRDEADFQLHLIYLWYEDRAPDAAALLGGLRDRHPTNPLFPLLLAEVQDVYFHDPTAALATYAGVLEAARESRVRRAALAEGQARLGIARQLEALAETDRAIDHLTEVLAREPEPSSGVHALAALRLGQAYDRVGLREPAVIAYRTAASRAPAGDPLKVVPQANQGLRRRPDPRAGDAYRLALEGWRALQRHDLETAEGRFARSLDLQPDDPVTQYRYGRLLMARGDEAGALAAFDRALLRRVACPAPILASALLDAGRLHERAGRRDRAAALYRSASHVFGASADTRLAAARALARLAPRS
jgi:tetratricopeptide (TPR) repeat protein